MRLKIRSPKASMRALRPCDARLESAMTECTGEHAPRSRELHLLHFAHWFGFVAIPPGYFPRAALRVHRAYFALQAPLGLLVGLGNARAETEASANRLIELLKSTPSTPEPCDTPLTPPRSASIDVSRRAIRIRVKAVLRDIDLSIPFGQHIALVGPSGAGNYSDKAYPATLRSKQRCSLNRKRRSSPMQNRRRATIFRHRSAGTLLLPQ